ncbi:hypothetical protein BpHYR1_017754 [Brachionus plicatilis]|uniref:Uncharacterized protein n=1 Tax=Brachionus plicatilis TaxID=10195 RepID=A0A3M7S6C9_BRAPC|nr:hypothetical protein BpHYR1_017754 [Brachionus plicatilis]
MIRAVLSGLDIALHRRFQPIAIVGILGHKAIVCRALVGIQIRSIHVGQRILVYRDRTISVHHLSVLGKSAASERTELAAACPTGNCADHIIGPRFAQVMKAGRTQKQEQTKQQKADHRPNNYGCYLATAQRAGLRPTRLHLHPEFNGSYIPVKSIQADI